MHVSSLSRQICPGHGSLPAWQTPPAPQVSAPLQNTPSSQSLSSTQSTHVSSLSRQDWPGQGSAPGWHTPFASHVSSPLQNNPSGQGVPEGRNTSVGQPGELPVQNSATSQTPAAGRHSVLAGSRLARHVPDPSHVSGLSQSVSLVSPQAEPADLFVQLLPLVAGMHAWHSLAGFASPLL